MTEDERKRNFRTAQECFLPEALKDNAKDSWLVKMKWVLCGWNLSSHCRFTSWESPPRAQHLNQRNMAPSTSINSSLLFLCLFFFFLSFFFFSLPISYLFVILSWCGGWNSGPQTFNQSSYIPITNWTFFSRNSLNEI